MERSSSEKVSSASSPDNNSLTLLIVLFVMLFAGDVTERECNEGRDGGAFEFEVVVGGGLNAAGVMLLFEGPRWS